MLPKLKGIDHIHVYVADREAAADWYERVLGFKVVETLAFWADNEAGPLTIEDTCGTVHLALFNSDDFIPSTVIAYSTDGQAFLQWKTYLERQNILDRCSDHTAAWSLYFKDLDGNSNEITTYDYDLVAEKLKPEA